MFERQFGLRENPFVAGHQSRFVYPSREHQEALAHLRYGIENREPFVLITGEVGTGKTTALYDVLGEWQSRVVVALITNSALTRDELLEEICLRFGVPTPPGATKPQLLQNLERHLLAVRARGERAILILDEAQNLSRDLLEEIRLLSNLEVQGEKLVQVFLVGQPELEAVLARPELRQLRQRIAVHYRLNPLNEQDTERYVHHRLSVAGGHAVTIFPADACREVFRLTHGIPREINTVAAQAMLNAFVEDQHVVRPSHVSAVENDTEFQSVVRGSMRGVPAPEAPPAPARTAPAPEPPRSETPARPAPEAPRSEAPVRLTPVPPSAPPPPMTPTHVARVEPDPPHPQPQPATNEESWRSWREALASMPGGTAAAAATPAPEKPAPSASVAPSPAPAPPAPAAPKPAETRERTPAPAHESEFLHTPEAPRRTYETAQSEPKAPKPPAPKPAPAAPALHVVEKPAASAADPMASLPPNLRRKLEFEDAPEPSNAAVRWLVVASVLALVLISGVLAGRFLKRPSAPAPAPTSAERTPSETPATSAPESAPPAASAEAPKPQPSAEASKPVTTPPAATNPVASTTKPAANATKPAASATKPAVSPPESKPQAQPAVSSAPATTPARPKPAAPEAAKTPAPAPTRGFGIAVRTLLYEDRAREEAQRLGASSGLPSRVVPVSENGETSYRVVLGAFVERAAADKAAGRLIEQGLADEARVVPVSLK